MLQKLKGNKKGFTLAELLIVVAIIAVLVAIAIPAFSGALTSAEEAVENANMRSARSEATVAYLLAGNTGDAYYTFTVSPSGVIVVTYSGTTGTESIAKDATNGGYVGVVKVTASDYST